MRISDWSSDVCSSDLWLATLPAKLLKPQPLAVVAMRARHEVAALVRRFELVLHCTGPGNRWGRDDQDLAPGKGAGARFGQRDRVAFTFHIQRVAIHLIEEQVAHRHGTQAHRAVDRKSTRLNSSH